jgi:hypothetical protein
MRILFSALCFVSLIACQSPAPAPTGESTTSATAPSLKDPSQWSASDKALTPLLDAYFSLKDALVEWDSTAVDAAAARVKAFGDSLSADTSLLSAPLRTHVSSVSAEAAGLLEEQDLTEKRRAFHMMSEHLLPLLKEAAYGAQPVYQQVCPMAFNDTETAYWLSNSREIVNPYLGKKHPKYASGMLHCGELNDSLTVRP